MSLKPQKIHFDFNSKKPFKYDSSDNEDNNKQEYINNKQYIHHEIKDTNKFFFDINDICFNGLYFILRYTIYLQIYNIIYLINFRGRKFFFKRTCIRRYI